jgi:hypothetical protein
MLSNIPEREEMHGNLSSIIVIIVNEILLRPEANKNVIKP